MTTLTLAKGLARALTASAIYAAAAASAGATTLTLIDPPTQTGTPETVTFTATATESLVIDEGYQVNDLETLTNNAVTLSGGGPNLLGSTWQYRFAALGSNSYTFNDGTAVPALGFAAQDPPDMDTFYQFFATVPGKSYTYTFDYSNNTAGSGATPSLLIATASSVPEASTWASLLLGFLGLCLAGRGARRAAGAIA
jgi:FtsP/CotA-like multicopper oxidase with cupredoxin domain